MDFTYRAAQLSVETRSMESRNPVTCTSQYRANFFRYVIYTRAYRILHSLRACLLARARTKNRNRGTNTREEFGQVLGKYSGLFQRVLSAIGRSHAPTREGMERVSFLQCVQVLSYGISTGQWAGFVFLSQFPPTRPVAHEFGSTLQRGRRRTEP